MTPTIGRIVIYREAAREYPAMVVRVNDDYSVDLQVFFDDGDGCSLFRDVRESSADVAGTWHWPERS